MAENQEPKVEGTPIPAGVFDPALGVKTLEQAAKMTKDAQRAITEAGEAKKRAQELEEENRRLNEALQAPPPPDPGNGGEPQDMSGRSWSLAPAGRRAFVEDLQADPLQAVVGVATVIADRRAKDLEARLAAAEEKLSARDIADKWGDQTQDCVAHYGPQFVEAHQNEITKLMQSYGKKPPADNALFRHFAEVQKREATSSQTPPPPKVEGATGVPSAMGPGKWTNPDGTPMTSEQMRPYLVAQGELEPGEK